MANPVKKEIKLQVKGQVAVKGITPNVKVAHSK